MQDMWQTHCSHEAQDLLRDSLSDSCEQQNVITYSVSQGQEEEAFISFLSLYKL